jgi:transposase
MIKIEQYWMAVEPIDMRAGMETVLGKVVAVFGSAQAHHAYLFTNRRANRIKVLVSDGFGVWLAIRRLHEGHFVRAQLESRASVELTQSQLEALLLGLPWQRLGKAHEITVS